MIMDTHKIEQRDNNNKRIKKKFSCMNYVHEKKVECISQEIVKRNPHQKYRFYITFPMSSFPRHEIIFEKSAEYKQVQKVEGQSEGVSRTTVTHIFKSNGRGWKMLRNIG